MILFTQVYREQVNLAVCWLAIELALGEHGDLITRNGLHLGIVCVHDLGSNWPSYTFMSVLPT